MTQSLSGTSFSRCFRDFATFLVSPEKVKEIFTTIKITNVTELENAISQNSELVLGWKNSTDELAYQFFQEGRIKSVSQLPYPNGKTWFCGQREVYTYHEISLTKNLLIHGPQRTGKSKYAQALIQSWADTRNDVEFLLIGDSFGGFKVPNLLGIGWTTVDASAALAKAKTYIYCGENGKRKPKTLIVAIDDLSDIALKFTNGDPEISLRSAFLKDVRCVAEKGHYHNVFFLAVSQSDEFDPYFLQRLAATQPINEYDDPYPFTLTTCDVFPQYAVKQNFSQIAS